MITRSKRIGCVFIEQSQTESDRVRFDIQTPYIYGFKIYISKEGEPVDPYVVSEYWTRIYAWAWLMDMIRFKSFHILAANILRIK